MDQFPLVSSVTQSFLTLRPRGLQHTRPPCPSPTPRVYTNSCLLSRWCNPTIPSSVVPFSSDLQSFPAAGSFQMSQFFTSGGQGIGVSASASVLPMNIQDWFLLGWTGWIFCSPRDCQGTSFYYPRDLIFAAPKSLQMVTAAMKLKDICSLEVKLWTT